MRNISESKGGNNTLNKFTGIKSSSTDISNRRLISTCGPHCRIYYVVGKSICKKDGEEVSLNSPCRFNLTLLEVQQNHTADISST